MECETSGKPSTWFSLGQLVEWRPLKNKLTNKQANQGTNKQVKSNTQHDHNTQHTTHNTQHTTPNTQHTTPKTHHTTDNTQHTAGNTVTPSKLSTWFLGGKLLEQKPSQI